MTAAPLTVHNAEIRTATVEIKTLTVSGKQVTLAVFRQLINAGLISDDGHLQGTPWGIVNYHPDKCAEQGRHRHVVWQDGAELRRSAVRTTPDFDGWPFSCTAGTEYLDACVIAAIDGALTEFGGTLPCDEKGAPGAVKGFSNLPEGIELRASTDAAVAWRWSATLTAPSKLAADTYRNRADLSLERLRAAYTARGLNIDQLRIRLFEAAHKEGERRQRYRAALDTVAALPQLFIAV